MATTRIYSIGRDMSNDIIIDDYTDVVSRNHATLKVEGRKMFIIDHSTNGTYKNGIKLIPNMEYPVSTEDEVSFGGVSFLDWNRVIGMGKSGSSSSSKVVLTVVICAVVVIAVAAAALLYFKPFEKTAQEAPLVEEVAKETQAEEQKEEAVAAEEAEKKAAEQKKADEKKAAKKKAKAEKAAAEKKAPEKKAAEEKAKTEKAAEKKAAEAAAKKSTEGQQFSTDIPVQEEATEASQEAF